MSHCEFCNKKFKTNSILNHHKKTTKYCLKIQNKNNTELECKFCSKNFTSKQSLDYHLQICKHVKENSEEILKNDIEKLKLVIDEQKNDIEKFKLVIDEQKNDIEKLKLVIDEQKNYISKLEAKIEIYEKDHETIFDIAKQTKITNTNNIINNLAIFDIDKITENFSSKLEYITKEDIINGQKGIANILAPCLYDNGNKMITCTDKSRLIFTKMDKNNNKVKDQELKNLAILIKPLALKKADEIFKEHTKLKEKMYNIDLIKSEIKDYISYINNFRNIINNYKIANVKSGLIKDYEDKIEKYQKIIDKNNEILAEYGTEDILCVEEIEEENDKILDGHTDIKHLDSESTKFARQMSKLL